MLPQPKKHINTLEISEDEFAKLAFGIPVPGKPHPGGPGDYERIQRKQIAKLYAILQGIQKLNPNFGFEIFALPARASSDKPLPGPK